MGAEGRQKCMRYGRMRQGRMREGRMREGRMSEGRRKCIGGMEEEDAEKRGERK